MNKKIRNRILYVTVTLLWAVAIYRTFVNYQTEENIVAAHSNNSISITPINAYIKDSFELMLPNRDPFLNKSFIPKIETAIKPNQTPDKTEKQKLPIAKPSVVWPDIEYFGFVKNRTTSSTRCLLKIDNQTIQLSKGEKFSGIEIMYAFSDSVRLKFESSLKTIYK